MAEKHDKNESNQEFQIEEPTLEVNQSEQVDATAVGELESGIQSFETRQEIASKTLDELGGMEGINEVIEKMPKAEQEALRNKIKEKELEITTRIRRIQGFGKDSSIDQMWEITKMLLDIPDFYEANDVVPHGLREIGTAGGFVIGLALATTTAIPAGIQNILRRMKLGLEERKLNKLKAAETLS